MDGGDTISRWDGSESGMEHGSGKSLLGKSWEDQLGAG